MIKKQSIILSKWKEIKAGFKGCLKDGMLFHLIQLSFSCLFIFLSYINLIRGEELFALAFAFVAIINLIAFLSKVGNIISTYNTSVWFHKKYLSEQKKPKLDFFNMKEKNDV